MVIVATLHLMDNCVLVGPRAHPALTEALSYWHKEQLTVEELEREAAANTGVIRKQLSKYSKSTARLQPLYTIDTRYNPDTAAPEPYLSTMPGMAFRVRETLQGIPGESVQIVDNRTPMPEPDYEAAMALLRDYQKEGVTAMLYSGGGILACPTGWGKTYVMAALASAYDPEQLRRRGTPLTVIVTPGEDIIRKNVKAFREFFPFRDVQLMGAGGSTVSNDIQFVTPGSLEKVPLGDAAILIYDEVHLFTMRQAHLLMAANRARRWGVSATPTGRYDNADLVVEGMFGPVTYRRSYRDGVADGAITPLTVMWMRQPRPDHTAKSAYASREAEYRHGVTFNRPFHRFAAEILDKFSTGVQCLAVVDKTAHMNELLRFLPSDTPYVHGAASVPNGTYEFVTGVKKSKRRALYEQFCGGELRRMVSTGVYRTGVSFDELQVLLNLEGMRSSIISGQLPGRCSRLHGQKRQAFLVDFWPDWNHGDRGKRGVCNGALLADAHARRAEYDKLGFEQYFLGDDVDALVAYHAQCNPEAV